jgi:hypothetical protein
MNFMNEIDVFYILKNKVLETFKMSFPYFKGSINDFGNKEIAQLIDLIEIKSKSRISEKWVYTHLKPIINEKIPRKDMLDILSKFSGFESWDEFLFKHSENTKEINISNEKPKSYKIIIMITIISTLIFSLVFGLSQMKQKVEKTICFKDKYTQKIIPSDKFEVFRIETPTENLVKKIKQKITYGCVKYENNDFVTFVISSPYYKSQTFKISSNMNIQEISLQPDDYAMMIRSCMNANLKDWTRRKLQLENCIDNDAEIEEVMFDEIGVDFLNKQDFISKITTPTETLKKMEIIEIKYKNDKIISLKFIQK